MLGRVMGLGAGDQPPGLPRQGRLAGRPHEVRARVVTDQDDPLHLEEQVVRHPPQRLGQARAGPRGGHSRAALTQQRRERHEHVGGPLRTHPRSQPSTDPGLAGRSPREWATSWRLDSPGQASERRGSRGRSQARSTSPIAATRPQDASGTHHSLTPRGALPRFFQVVRDRGGAHRLDVPELDGLVREQADRPVVVALRRVRAREGDDPRLDVPVDLEVSRG